jgi:hypothetical protein
VTCRIDRAPLERPWKFPRRPDEPGRASRPFVPTDAQPQTVTVLAAHGVSQDVIAKRI